MEISDNFDNEIAKACETDKLGKSTWPPPLVALSRRYSAAFSQKPVDYFIFLLENQSTASLNLSSLELQRVSLVDCMICITQIQSTSLPSRLPELLFGKLLGYLAPENLVSRLPGLPYANPVDCLPITHHSNIQLLNQPTTLISHWKTSRLVSSVTQHECFRDSFFTYTETLVIPISV